MNIALVALMGLPSSGKSTLCSAILKQNYPFQEPTKILQFAYDEFVPLSVQRGYSIISQENGCDGGISSNITLAKILRSRFLRTIEYLVNKLKNLETDCFNDSLIMELNDILDSELSTAQVAHCLEKLLELESFGSKLFRIVESVHFNEYKNVVVLMDDNNYYHSMRNEVFQIAKKYKTGFCILYSVASIQECLTRNSERDVTTRVPENVIETMNSKLEEPDPLKNACDIFCVQIRDVRDDRIHSEIQAMLESSLLNPVDIEVEDRTEEIERERRICAENEIHQADQILRKWIHTYTITSRLAPGGSSQSKDSLRAFSQNLLQKKNVIISGLRSGDITVKSQVSDFLGFQKEILALANNQS